MVTLFRSVRVQLIWTDTFPNQLVPNSMGAASLPRNVYGWGFVSPRVLVTAALHKWSWIWHHITACFYSTLRDKSCSGAVCSSGVAQWEVRPEAGCRWGAWSHTQLPPLGCLSAFQPLSFPTLKMHQSSSGGGLEKVKYEWRPTVNSRSADAGAHSCA